MINGLKKVDEFQEKFMKEVKKPWNLLKRSAKGSLDSQLKYDVNIKGEKQSRNAYADFYYNTETLISTTLCFDFNTGLSLRKLEKNINLDFPHECVHYLQAKGVMKKSFLLPTKKYSSAPNYPKPDVTDHHAYGEWLLRSTLHDLEPLEIDAYIAQFYGYCKNNRNRLNPNMLTEGGKGNFGLVYTKTVFEVISVFEEKKDEFFEDLWFKITGLKWKKNKAINFLRKTAEKRKKTWINKAGKILWLMMEEEKKKKQHEPEPTCK